MLHGINLQPRFDFEKSYGPFIEFVFIATIEIERPLAIASTRSDKLAIRRKSHHANTKWMDAQASYFPQSLDVPEPEARCVAIIVSR